MFYEILILTLISTQYKIIFGEFNGLAPKAVDLPFNIVKLGPYCCKPGKLLVIDYAVSNGFYIITNPNYHGGQFSFDSASNASLAIFITYEGVAVSTSLAGRVESSKTWKLSVDKDAGNFLYQVLIGCLRDSFKIYFNDATQEPPDFTYFSAEYPDTTIVNRKNEFWVVGGYYTNNVEVHCYPGFVNEPTLPYSVHIGETITSAYVPPFEIMIILYVKGTKRGNFDIDIFNGDQIMMTMSVRFHDEQVVFNSQSNGDWQKEEVVDGFAYPFGSTPNIYRINFIFYYAEIETRVNDVILKFFDYRLSKHIDRIKISSRDDDFKGVDILAFEKILWEKIAVTPIPNSQVRVTQPSVTKSPEVEKKSQKPENWGNRNHKIDKDKNNKEHNKKHKNEHNSRSTENKNHKNEQDSKSTERSKGRQRIKKSRAHVRRRKYRY